MQCPGLFMPITMSSMYSALLTLIPTCSLSTVQIHTPLNWWQMFQRAWAQKSGPEDIWIVLYVGCAHEREDVPAGLCRIKQRRMTAANDCSCGFNKAVVHSIARMCSFPSEWGQRSFTIVAPLPLSTQAKLWVNAINMKASIEELSSE